ncbi:MULTISPECIES: hypothetical protein [unclassified Microcoleus]
MLLKSKQWVNRSYLVRLEASPAWQKAFFYDLRKEPLAGIV